MDNRSFSYLPGALVINVPEIDAQHADIFERLASLKVSCIDHNAYMQEEADELFVTLVEHFETEARLAREAGVDFRRHGEKHLAMLHGIRKRLDEMEHPEADVYGLIRYIEYWLERHIREEDKWFAKSLGASGFSGVAQAHAEVWRSQDGAC